MSVAEKTMEEPESPPVVGAIHLVRHGRPDLSRKIWLTRKGFNAWWGEYGRVGLVEGQEPPSEIASLTQDAALLVSSPIPRARETADLLAGDKPIKVSADFVEAPLPAPLVLPFWRITPPLWGTLARFTWWLGYSAGEESRYECERRAQRAADRLIEMAADAGGDVVVCGHGWFNHMLGRELKKRGWRRTGGDGRKGYWSHSSFAPPL